MHAYSYTRPQYLRARSALSTPGRAPLTAAELDSLLDGGRAASHAARTEPVHPMLLAGDNRCAIGYRSGSMIAWPTAHGWTVELIADPGSSTLATVALTRDQAASVLYAASDLLGHNLPLKVFSACGGRAVLTQLAFRAATRDTAATAAAA